MQRLLSFAALLLTVLAAPFSDSTLAEWNDYKAAYNKFYETPEEDARRLEIYLQRKRTVEEHNSRYQRGETSFTMAINKFADWFPEELERLNGLKVEKPRRGGSIYQRQPNAVVPDSINWVKKGAVTSVKDQKTCGSCYAFSAVGALEGLMFRTNKTVTSLSVQELMDCSVDFSCEGGLPIDCYESVKWEGLEAEASYPYEARSGTCRADRNKSILSCTGFKMIEMGDEEALKEAVGLVGPVSIGMGVSMDWSLYHKGIFDGTCSAYVNHAMLVVGYGTDEETGRDYWLIKNSWGTLWGEGGYGKVIRNENKCFIADDASYPTEHGK